MKRKLNWLDRRIAHPGPYLVLCKTEQELGAALDHLGVKDRPVFMASERANATAHFFDNAHDGQLAAVVCIGSTEGRNAIEIAGLLVHEAVHVWQRYARSIGENNPGDEQEAYAVQAIAQELMMAYAETVA